MSNEHVLRLFTERLGRDFTSPEEVSDYLSEKFVEALKGTKDAQEAFNNLNKEIGGNLLWDNCSYVLSNGGAWYVDVSDAADIPKLATKLNICTADKLDIIAEVSEKVLNTMSNAGCDCKTALQLELDDAGLTEECGISIVVPEGEPKIYIEGIEFLDDEVNEESE